MLDARELVRDDRYAQKWKRTARALGREIERALTSRAELACILALLVAIPDGAQLMIGNSLPVREADLACLTGVSAPRVVLHQRGAAGIDGLVAGASGAASFGTPTVLLLGDVSLLHDLHGLLVAGRRADNLIIAVIDNAGGRIFDGLAIGRRADLAGAHALFTTPHTHDLAALAQFAGVAYARAEVAEAIAPLVRAASARRGATLLHVVVDAESAARLDAALPRLIEAALTAEERAS
jgi:2-succinyl-5-enolpyruvyl-6-hydroxy-3-cyclohexene-1-carboxylate synthase